MRVRSCFAACACICPIDGNNTAISQNQFETHDEVKFAS